MLRGADKVAQFARRMVSTLNLPRNADKPGWDAMTLHALEEKLDEEYAEVKEAITRLKEANYPVTMKEEVIRLHVGELERLLAEECTDLGNISMMITDRVGGLDG